MRIIMALLLLLTQQVCADVSGIGIVEPDPRYVLNVNFSHAGQISKVYVSPGQHVKTGDPLVTMTTDPTVLTTYQQDLATLELAQQDVERTARLVELKLATPAQYALAQKALFDAKAKVNVHKQLGEDNPENTYTATFDGLVTAVLVSAGDRIQPGANLLQIVPKDKFVARIGLDPSDAKQVQPGQLAKVSALANSSIYQEAKVSDVFHRINPQNQQVEVLIPIVEPSELLPGTQVKAVFSQ